MEWPLPATEVELLVEPNCPQCDAIRLVLEGLAREFPHLKIRVVDVSREPETAARYGFGPVIGVAINGRLEFEGHLSEQELRNRLQELSGLMPDS